MRGRVGATKPFPPRGKVGPHPAPAPPPRWGPGGGGDSYPQRGGAGAVSRQTSAGPGWVSLRPPPRRILYLEGEPRWEYKFIRQAEEDDRMVKIVSIDRTSENKIYRQGVSDPKE